MSQGSQGRKGRLSVGFALGAAALFGLSAPAGKALLAVTDPWLLAGLLYLGSGLALGAYRAVRDFRSRSTAREALLGRQDWPWLGAAILTGGVIAPVLLMFGLSRVSAAEASLLLNLEGVFTAVVAWVVFREHVDGRIAGGMVAIALGAMVLAWDPGQTVKLSAGALLVAGACLGWASGRRERRHCPRARRICARPRDGIAGRVAWTGELRRQLGALRPRASRPGCGTHECVLLNGALRRCGDRRHSAR